MLILKKCRFLLTNCDGRGIWVFLDDHILNLFRFPKKHTRKNSFQKCLCKGSVWVCVRVNHVHVLVFVPVNVVSLCIFIRARDAVRDDSPIRGGSVDLIRIFDRSFYTILMAFSLLICIRPHWSHLICSERNCPQARPLQKRLRMGLRWSTTTRIWWRCRPQQLKRSAVLKSRLEVDRAVGATPDPTPLHPRHPNKK